VRKHRDELEWCLGVLMLLACVFIIGELIGML
jgi:hypothetical protein